MELTIHSTGEQKSVLSKFQTLFSGSFKTQVFSQYRILPKLLAFAQKKNYSVIFSLKLISFSWPINSNWIIQSLNNSFKSLITKVQRFITKQTKRILTGSWGGVLLPNTLVGIFITLKFSRNFTLFIKL